MLETKPAGSRCHFYSSRYQHNAFTSLNCADDNSQKYWSFTDEETSPLVQFEPHWVNRQEVKEDSAEEDVVDVKGNVDVVKLHLLQELWRVAEVTVELGTDERWAVETVERVERALESGSEVWDLVEGMKVRGDVRVAAGEAEHGKEHSQHWSDEHSNL